MKQYTYLLVNFFTIIICFIFSFDKRIQFYKYFGAFFKAAIPVAIIFIAWDIWFTHEGVWWFNQDYTVGKSIFGLPIEEWLFFICIPFACIFTFYCLDKFFNLDRANKYSAYIVWPTIVVCFIVSVLFHNRLYPFITALLTGGIIIYLYFIVKADWIGKASFVYIVLMLGFFPVNGILTGTGLESPIVNYNSDEILNIRILTIPIEDAVYGYAQFILTVYFFVSVKRRQ